VWKVTGLKMNSGKTIVIIEHNRTDRIEENINKFAMFTIKEFVIT